MTRSGFLILGGSLFAEHRVRRRPCLTSSTLRGVHFKALAAELETRLEVRLREERLGIRGRQALAETLADVPEDDDDLNAEILDCAEATNNFSGLIEFKRYRGQAVEIAVRMPAHHERNLGFGEPDFSCEFHRLAQRMQ